MKYIKSNWYEWMSEDNVLWWPNRYLYSENIDVLSNSNYIQLYNKPTKAIYTLKNVNNQLSIINRITNASTVLAFCDDWQVYSEDEWDTAVYDNSSLGNLEYPVFTLWDYVYFVNNTWPTSAFKLNRLTIANAFSATWTPTLAYKDLATDNYFEYSGVVISWPRAYIWLGNKISVFNSWNNTVSEYSLSQEEIAWITYMSWYFRVYTENWNLYLWDWDSKLITEQINLWLNIERVKQVSNIDYVMTWELWEESGLYIVNWYTLTPLFREKNSSQISKWKFKFEKWAQTSIWNHFDNILLINEVWNWNTVIDIYGNGIQGLPKWYTNLMSLCSTWKKIDTLKSVIVFWWYAYIWFSDIDWQNGVDKIYLRNTWTKQTSWEIVTNINDMQTWIDKKSLQQLFFRVWDITATQYIEVYTSIDWWTYTLKHTVNTQPKDNIVRLPLVWDFRDISIKFKFYTNSSTSPKIYNWYVLKYEQSEPI